MIEEKKCSRCRVKKPKTNDFFYSRKNSKDGFQGVCKECVLSARKAGGVQKDESKKQCSTCDKWFPRTKDFFHLRKQSKDGFRNSCKECSRSWTYRWREDNRELYLERKQKNRKAPHRVAKTKEYNNKPEVKRRRRFVRKRWRQENREHYLSYNRNYLRERRKEDPHFRAKSNVSRAIRMSLSERGSSKKGSSVWTFLPYSLEELITHLEKLFSDEMSWENYGSYWHIDHIYPQSLLPFDSMEHPNFIKCWSLNNLQPLEALENIRKSNKTIITWSDGRQEEF